MLPPRTPTMVGLFDGWYDVASGEGETSLTGLVRALCHLSRWGGNLLQPWTVGQHTLLGYHEMEAWLDHDPGKFPRREDLLAAWLLHDLHEPLVGEVPSPVKQALRTAGVSAWDDLEARASHFVHARAGAGRLLADADVQAAVQAVDRTVAGLEAHILGQGLAWSFRADGRRAHGGFNPLYLTQPRDLLIGELLHRYTLHHIDF